MAPPLSLSLQAPAKLNLFLHITGRRTDGYHNLQTLFQLIDYGDRLNLRVRQDGELHLTPPRINGLRAADNLIIKAATALQQATTCRLGASLHLEKILPIGGGLGGGSSNAASTLVGLNHLWQTGLTVDELAQLGRRLGADVPVFVRAESAWAEGIGERLQALVLPSRWFVVVSPPCQIATEVIFKHKDLTRDSRPITVAAFFEQGGRNDCQALVQRLYPEIDAALTWLNAYGQAQLTGTGACVFASFENADAARAALAQKPPSLAGFVAKGIDRSPLYDLLNAA